MSFLSNSSAARKPPETTTSSTTDWRRQWWAAESKRTGTDWISLLAAAEAALLRLRTLHAVGASS